MDRKRTLAAALGAAFGVGAARIGDFALVGGSIAAAAGAVGFAGYMTLAAPRTPRVNGMQYLAIFAQPSRTERSPQPEARAIDLSPVGAVPHDDKSHAAGYAVVGAEPRFAWLREGNRIFAAHPGEDVPRLGRIAAIVLRDGRWTLVDDKGAVLIASAAIESSPGGGRFDKPMILRPAPR